MQYDIQDRRKVYSILSHEGIEIPRYAVLDRDNSSEQENHGLIESEDRELTFVLEINIISLININLWF